MKNFRCLHFGSYWMGNNDVVYAMVTDLKKLCNTRKIDVGIYNSHAKKWYRDDFGNDKTYPIRWLRHEMVVSVINSFKPNVIICNAGGLSLTQQSFQICKEKNITTIGISLSDPDVFQDQSSHYYKYFDLFYSNSLYSLNGHYLNSSHVHLLPFAASSSIHKPLNIKKMYDIVVIGHARSERIELIGKLQGKFKVKTFGIGWDKNSSVVQGKEQVRAINLGKIYLSFPQTMAGFNNVKVGMFEAAACKGCIILPYIDEIQRYFSYGIDILGYSNFQMLEDLLKEYLHNDKLRTWIANNAYNRFLEQHTWTRRWESVFQDIRKLRHG